MSSATQQLWNKKSAINAFVNSYQIPFDVRDDQIDLREMSKNYPGGVIPLHDIHAGICSVLDPKYTISPPEAYDPSADPTSPKFAYLDWEDLYLWPIFQRDVATNHVEKIFKHFDPTCILVACAIKLTLKDHPSYGPNGRTVYCIWDGHHTSQVCKLKNYTKYPMWYIDIDNVPDSQIQNKGFGVSDEERIKYGIFLAGSNMRMINLTIKRPLDPYDDFMIGVETFDPKYVAIMNILNKNNCVVKKRASSEPGAFNQIKAGIKCYEATDTNGMPGRFFDRALAFHRKHWPGAPLELEIFRPMTLLFHTADIQGINIPHSFDDELGNLLVDQMGDVQTVQQVLKDSYWNALTSGKVSSSAPNLKADPAIVLASIQNFYRQNAGPKQHIIPSPVAQWTVDVESTLKSIQDKIKPSAKAAAAKKMLDSLPIGSVITDLEFDDTND